MADDLDELAALLLDISDSLAERALDRLRQASQAVRDGGDPDPGLVAEEKRITRARRAVDKAAALLAGPSGATAYDDGP